MVKRVRRASMVMLVFTAITAIWGGAGLMYDPSGDYMMMSLQFLRHSPFTSYFIPGLILFIVNGLLNLVAFVLVLTKHRYYPYAMVVQGMVLATWLSVQIIMVKVFFVPMHLPYYIIALLLVTFGSSIIRSGQK